MAQTLSLMPFPMRQMLVIETELGSMLTQALHPNHKCWQLELGEPGLRGTHEVALGTKFNVSTCNYVVSGPAVSCGHRVPLSVGQPVSIGAHTSAMML